MDSFDLVPIGGFWGKGRRKNVIGAYILAAYYSKNNTYEAICR